MNTDYPIHSQVDVFINRPLKHTFSKAVNEESLYSGTVILYDSKDSHIVDGVLSYDADTFTITFLPETALTPNTAYTWTFAGTESDEDVSPLKFADDTYLQSSIFIDFQTGKGVFTSAIQEALGQDIEILEDGQTYAERLIDTFKVISTTPSHLDSNVPVTLDTITITFSSPLKDGIVLEDFFTVKYEALLRDTYLFNNGKFNNVVATQPGKVPVITDFSIPEFTLSIDANRTTVTITKPADKYLNANCFVKVIINKNLENNLDEKLNSGRNEELYFLTELFPMFTNLQSILLSLYELEGSISEEVALRYILKNSFDIWQLSGRAFSLTSPPPAAISYVECATILDLLDGKNISKEINKGKSIKLADISITFDYPRTPESATITLRTTSKQCMDVSRKEILALSGKGEFMIGERGKNIPLVNNVYRNRIDFSSGRRNNNTNGIGF